MESLPPCILIYLSKYISKKSKINLSSCSKYLYRILGFTKSEIIDMAIRKLNRERTVCESLQNYSHCDHSQSNYHFLEYLEECYLCPTIINGCACDSIEYDNNSDPNKIRIIDICKNCNYNIISHDTTIKCNNCIFGNDMQIIKCENTDSGYFNKHLYCVDCEVYETFSINESIDSYFYCLSKTE